MRQYPVRSTVTIKFASGLTVTAVMLIHLALAAVLSATAVFAADKRSSSQAASYVATPLQNYPQPLIQQTNEVPTYSDQVNQISYPSEPQPSLYPAVMYQTVNPSEGYQGEQQNNEQYASPPVYPEQRPTNLIYSAPPSQPSSYQYQPSSKCTICQPRFISICPLRCVPTYPIQNYQPPQYSPVKTYTINLPDYKEANYPEQAYDPPNSYQNQPYNNPPGYNSVSPSYPSGNSGGSYANRPSNSYASPGKYKSNNDDKGEKSYDTTTYRKPVTTIKKYSDRPLLIKSKPIGYVRTETKGPKPVAFVRVDSSLGTPVQMLRNRDRDGNRRRNDDDDDDDDDESGRNGDRNNDDDDNDSNGRNRDENERDRNDRNRDENERD
ncbi:adhesive plaque matrix protein-like [Neocloeon triangulifer]|uniref:adhesive plaque matrix protein-like n=1 Tax=Neocloeon triangulifer TaxID=2078957 RepID=UPI00286EB949|nr:adhesive plaque matrix protein-like [Neocloeon triangulifer]